MIPKTIYQTYSSFQNIPWLTRLSIQWMLWRNREYRYEFFDDKRIDDFIKTEFDEHTYQCYRKLNIGAAKADFFRYAVLLRKGGIYLDVDSTIVKKLDSLILPSDEAIVSKERNPEMYVQWALIFSKDHPFLKRTLEKVVQNISDNAFPHDVHKMTGPTAYSEAIRACLSENPHIQYREFGIDYKGYFRFKLPFTGLVFGKKEHWKTVQRTRPVLKIE